MIRFEFLQVTSFSDYNGLLNKPAGIYLLFPLILNKMPLRWTDPYLSITKQHDNTIKNRQAARRNNSTDKQAECN
jgi:hypothetical protein